MMLETSFECGYWRRDALTKSIEQASDSDVVFTLFKWMADDKPKAVIVGYDHWCELNARLAQEQETR